MMVTGSRYISSTSDRATRRSSERQAGTGSWSTVAPPTNDADAAAKTPAGRPVENPLRQLWVTETALTTALNTAYFAEQVGTFVIFMGVALVLSGIGFAVLTFGTLRHAQETEEKVLAAPAAAPNLATEAR